MNHLSSTPSGKKNVEPWAHKEQESIDVLLNWIESVGVQTDSWKYPSRRNSGFTNGPFVEIKELIGMVK